MALVKEPDKQETSHLNHRLPTAIVKRYHALVERGKKLRVNVPASFAEHFSTWLDEVETELNGMTVSKLRAPAKVEEQ
jgi:hypothetical protein